ncbi:pyridine nucleotide-disulfide oxidoreductase (plasmid) [Tardibacter chloracetimidivorans]|uniref:Pyridine nucleotide-disulfide oxidoreductase n=2 Tax=Sphingomonadaceae TaxID=41297 RepID=A0A1L4A058_9SPHN|nr:MULTISPECIES: FAD-dependent oxidoreductase [Sphingomonadaceae]API61271.1 pyridine nucleotide-disulfide oxidoreductase [Tardibacter chloracetimidivorans]MBB4151242.1 NTE family protein [Sphingobium scionense]
MSSETFDYLLLGGGLASATAAETLRREGAAGSICVLTAEDFPPYHRPRLSKQYLLGTSTEVDILVHPVDYYRQQNISLILGIDVTGIDPASRTVSASDGRTFAYGKLLIATGTLPRCLEVPGSTKDGVFYLRRKSDCDAVRDSAQPGRNAVILGASFLGMEIALSLIEMGLQVTMIDIGDRVLTHLESQAISAFFQDYAEGKGATILLGDTISEVVGDSRVTGIRTRDGRDIACDMVIVSMGVEPATHFLEGSGIQLENGFVSVDDRLRTNVEDVFAAGDVTRFYDPVFRCRRHIEHWDNAVRQGRLAARNMLGQRLIYDEVSYFYCEIGELGFDMLGVPEHADEWISRGDLKDQSYALFYMRDQVPRAAFMMGRPTGEIRVAEGLIRYRVNLDQYKERLGDPAYLLDKIPMQKVLVLQGGGALGAFECGVVRALEEERIFPDIIAGVSIGALNGAIIAGNPHHATEALKSFWDDITVVAPPLPLAEMRRGAVAAQILAFGVPNFFKPRWMPPFDLTSSWTGYYDTAPMRHLIAKYVDFASLKSSPVRLLVGAVNVSTAQLEVFDSYVDDMTPDHVLASGSLPPGFSWTVVDGTAYWDGGIVSNSPLDLVLDRCGPDGKQVYIVDLFAGEAPLPTNMIEVLARRDEVVYSERIRSDLRAREMTDAYRSMINVILSGIDPVERAKIMRHPRFIQLMGDGFANEIVRFQRPRRAGEASSRDYDFSDESVRYLQDEGYALVKQTLAEASKAGVSATPAANPALQKIKQAEAVAGVASPGTSHSGADAILQGIVQAEAQTKADPAHKIPSKSKSRKENP